MVCAATFDLWYTMEILQEYLIRMKETRITYLLFGIMYVNVELEALGKVVTMYG